MFPMSHYVLAAALLLMAAAPSAPAQGVWTEGSAAPEPYVHAYAGPGAYYAKDIFIRANQQDLYFETYPNFSARMEVRVGNGSWEVLNDEDYLLTYTPWPNVPTTPGEYTITVRDYGIAASSTPREIEYRLVVVPDAARGFSDSYGNTMVFWSGAGGDPAAIDQPVLVAEGIDADNLNLQEAYYALGSELFTKGRQRGADVIILNFKEGGQDMRLNADVLESAIQYLNGVRTGTKGLVVTGVSMGGVIARYALARMEANNISHGASHFVSIDAPQQGATIDDELQNFVEHPPPGSGGVPVPANLNSVAGMQLLKVAYFDDTTPSLHTRFFGELNALNGDGYPHQTENVGVAFSTDARNPDRGQEWLVAEIPFYLDVGFDIQRRTSEALPGSFLPLDVTKLWGRVVFGAFDWELDRKADPTFIPHDSALDIVNGQSRFEGDPIVPLLESTYHDDFDPDLVEPLLARIGFAPLPLSASISGPGWVETNVDNTWTANVDGGGPSYFYKWSHRRLPEDPSACDPPPPDPDPCTGNICVMGLPLCEEFPPDVSGRTFTYYFDMPAEYQLRLTVSDTDGGRDVVYKVVSAVIGGQAAEGSPEGDAARGAADAGKAAGQSTDAEVQPTDLAAAHASASQSLPQKGAVLEAFPNPFASGTTVRFGLAEASTVRLVVYDALGREVARLDEGTRAAGWHTARFDAADLPSGLYVVRLTAGAHVETIPVTVLR